ncbi:MAG TPA: PaaI family thioesterase [Mycobacteriales bacterium]
MDMSVEEFATLGESRFPGLIGFRVVSSEPGRLVARLDVRPDLLAPNGYLHAAAVVGLADTACGYACRLLLPDGSTGFTTVELKSNFLGTALSGTLEAVATVVHSGRTTQVWDAAVRHVETDRTIAAFRCTQLVLWPRG